jgi:hypothetical protein
MNTDVIAQFARVAARRSMLVKEAAPPGMLARLGTGLAGFARRAAKPVGIATGVAGAGYLGARQLQPTDYANQYITHAGLAQQQEHAYKADLDAFKADPNQGTGWGGFFGNSPADQQRSRATEIARREATLRSGNFGGGWFTNNAAANRRAAGEAGQAIAGQRYRVGGMFSHDNSASDFNSRLDAMLASHNAGLPEGQRVNDPRVAVTPRPATPPGQSRPNPGTWDGVTANYVNPSAGQEFALPPQMPVRPY